MFQWPLTIIKKFFVCDYFELSFKKLKKNFFVHASSGSQLDRAPLVDFINILRVQLTALSKKLWAIYHLLHTKCTSLFSTRALVLGSKNVYEINT